MNNTARSHTGGGATRIAGSLLGISGLVVLLAAHVASGAASTRLASATSPQAACDAALSQAAVSTIVGYKVPKPTGTTVDVKPTPANHQISSSGTTCEFSNGTSLADLKTTIVITKEVTSKALTAQVVETGLKTIKGSTVTVTPYGGLGGPALYYTQTLPGKITIYGMIAINGPTETSAARYTSTPQAELASLVKLGNKI
jgi:hypothetical protein